MKRVVLIFLILIASSAGTFAQTTPLEKFDQAVKEERAGFAGNKEKLSAVFNEERLRLGDKFEVELWKYLGSDPEKHYWIGYFLKSPSYLHGNNPLPDLALTIWQKGLELSKNETDEKNPGRRFTLLVVTSILAQKLEKPELAKEYKQEAVKITESGVNTAVHFPGLDEFDRCIYQNIGGDIATCQKDESPKEKIVLKGHINNSSSAVVEMPQPEASEKPRITGRVEVEIVIDVEGNVISAKAVGGTKELFKRAVALAKKAKFKPTLLAGVPVKVKGTVTYNFK